MTPKNVETNYVRVLKRSNWYDWTVSGSRISKHWVLFIFHVRVFVAFAHFEERFDEGVNKYNIDDNNSKSDNTATDSELGGFIALQV